MANLILRRGVYLRPCNRAVGIAAGNMVAAAVLTLVRGFLFCAMLLPAPIFKGAPIARRPARR